MTVARKAGEGVALGLGVAAVLGVSAYFGWRLLGPQILALAGAAGAEAGAEASAQLSSAAPGIGTQIGTAAGPAAVEAGTEAVKGTLFGGPSTTTEPGTVLLGGTPVEIV